MDLEEKILAHITEKDLPEEMQYFAKFIGFENVKTLMRIAGGSRPSIPMPSSFKTLALERIAKEQNYQFDFYGMKKLSREFDVHENTLKTIIKTGEENATAGQS